MAEAEAEKGTVEVFNPAANGAFFFNQPWAFLNIPNVHRSAHDPEGIIAFECRNGRARVEFDGVPSNTVSGEKFAEYAWMFACDMLEYEKAHISPQYDAA